MSRIWIFILNKKVHASPDNNHSNEQEIVALKDIGTSNIEIEDKDIVNLSVNNLVTWIDIKHWIQRFNDQVNQG